jgi:predicted transcriptional regulator
MGKRIFGELELAILQIIKSKTSCTVKEVQEALGGKDKYTTIMTVMSRLAAKGALHRERHGQQFRYSLLSNKPSYSLFEKWRMKIFKGKSSLMISYLLESGQDISDEELDKIEKLIQQVKRKGKS